MCAGEERRPDRWPDRCPPMQALAAAESANGPGCQPQPVPDPHLMGNHLCKDPCNPQQDSCRDDCACLGLKWPGKCST